jgi:predicted RNA-binding Zn-ribbon protein involved in translation (DUF1610 family)
LHDTVADLLADSGRVANVCCGCNSLGDIRIDLTAQFEGRNGPGETEATHLGDGRKIPFTDGAVDAVVTDPPWKVPFKDRVALFSEAVRVTKPGGRVITNAWWVPIHPFVTLERIIPTTANVSETDLGGPGGLSFLSVFSVDESEPEHGYSLADHFEIGGRDAINALARDCLHQQNQPTVDPRIRTTPRAFDCRQCGAEPYGSVRIASGKTVYHCPECGFPNWFGDLTACEVEPMRVE